MRNPNAALNQGSLDTPNYRRPFGCAVLELTQLSKMVAEGSDVSPMREHAMPIYVPANEALFSMLHQDIIANNSREYEKSSRAEMLAVSVKIFRGDASTIIRENMSLLQDIPLTLRLGFPDVVFPGDIRNELYVKLWSGEFPASHAQSARLSMVNFARPGPVAQNVEVTIEVRDSSGSIVENGISLGSSEPPVTQFHSMVFARNNQPTYGELIKLQLPLRGVPDWHLFFTFRNRSGNRALGPERPFAFAFQPLFPGQGAFLEDGSHTLVLYKADRLAQITPEMYLSSSPWVTPSQRPDQPSISPDLQRLAPPLRDTLIIRSSLCSTKFTQNPVLLSLLKWERIQDKELLSTVLSKFTFVGEGEIVKFLRDIFDSLFGILVSQTNQSGEMDHLVFNALVTVLGIVQDRRFSNFQPVLDVYIEQHFNCANASSHIMRSMDRLLRNPTGTDTASPLRAALKVWHYIFKFITRARELQKSTELGMSGGATAEHLEATFKKEVRTHLTEVNRMMATNSPDIIGTQTIALQNFTSIFPELAKVLSTIELVTVATNFANAISNAKGKIVMWRLIMYLQIVKGFLFDEPQSRTLLVQAVVLWIKPYFGRYDEFTQAQPGDSDNAKDASRVSWLESVRLCVTILAVMLDRLQQQLVSSTVLSDRVLFRQEQDNVEYLLMLLPRLLDSYREFQNPVNHRAIERTKTHSTSPAPVPVTFPESYPFSLMASLPSSPRNSASAANIIEDPNTFNPGLGETAIVLLALILSAPTKHIYNFLESSYDIEGKDNFAALLTQFFRVATSILDNDAWPSTWLNVNILAHKVLIKMMDPVSTLLKSIFIPSPSATEEFKSELWRDAFHMLFKLLSSDQLVIEDFTAQKRRAVWRLGGDIRGEGADILLRLWDALSWPENPEAEASQGGYRPVLSPLIGQIVNLCLSHHDSLRNNAVTILFGMIISEYQQFGHFEQIENELVRKLDSLFMSQSKGDDISRAFFIAHLRQLFDSEEVDDTLRERVSTFLDCVDAFLKLLLSLRNLPEGEEFADDRVIATLRLMNFIREIGREEMYIKYVHQLVNAHLQSQNYVEAALTLKLHSDLHEWDLYSFVPPMEDLGLPQQSQFHRKETLCLLILDYLGKGKAYESAIDICKELAKQHAEVTFNYTRLAEILRHQATLLEHIITDQRYYPDYFRVAFFGEFPDAIRSKQFIYRGFEWEKYGAFCERMLNKHPGAQLLKTPGDPPVDVRFGTDQYIQVISVSPEPNRTLAIFTCPDVPPTIRSYYEHSSVHIFSSSRPITKTDQNGNEEVWLEKTCYTTEQAFPTVLRRSDITEWEVVEISPVDHAHNEVEQKTRELDSLHLRYSALAKTAQIFSTNALSMTLNSAVDPPSESIPAYREAFFNLSYITRHSDREEQVERLRTVIDDHRCSDSTKQWKNSFRKNFAEEIGRIGAQGGFEDASPPTYARVNDQASLPEDASVQRILSSSGQSGLPALTLSTTVPPQPVSPFLSPREREHGAELPSPVKRTPLQLHAAHVARHGINGMSMGWRQEAVGSDPGSPAQFVDHGREWDIL
ncbi:putative cytoplasmic protein [Chiua virens]|nr:putative cytoplasmic protein [Chiua virens]